MQHEQDGSHPSIPSIALSGGPGAGKTTVMAAFLAAHSQTIQPVPEVATVLFSGLFPRVRSPRQREAVQQAIYHTQLHLESAYRDQCREGGQQILLCDRGTIDSAGFWPAGPQAFFTAMSTSLQQQLLRYDAVVFLESAAVGGLCIRAGNPSRHEDLQTATRIDRALYALWCQHPNFHHVPHEQDFNHKVKLGVERLEAAVRSITAQRKRSILSGA